ncbi:alkaline phosphatase synthesis sensor protein PhoR [Clostridium saccharobutylicum]|uniref:HAMP domain-containing sensor histidine kinase n=1 Tax=Clostridium saccharobutylicum TaxID=169679 RepID=UPI0009840514|nr:HAMP domain-containing sensor histidine kinase [Clostridium saccharobutylicum]AQR98738.1 alkaline phosphatase synthesis sensor protein PhoR [Clostridium saccharobutylicum]AQS12728.1 alkaline phosphatase synthesis sensor protein PhoR [Clostridium saccharobutylicum]
MKHSKNNRSVVTELFFTYFIGYISLTAMIMIGVFLSIIIYGILCTFTKYSSDFKELDNKLEENYMSITDDDLSKINGFIIKINHQNEIEYLKGNTIEEFSSINLETYRNMFGIMENNESSLNNDFKSIFMLNDFNNAKIQTKNDGVYSIYSRYMQEDGSLIVLGCPYKEIVKENFITKIVSQKLLFKSMLLLNIILAMVCVYVLAQITSKSFVKPIQTLLDGVIELTNGNYDVRINIKKKNEFLELTNGFNMMAETIQNERKEKEKLEKMREDLVLDISHDLKNPLSSILGYSETLMYEENLSEKEKLEYISIINKNSHRANKLINDLFEFSLYENCNYKLNVDKIDICEFLRQIVTFYISEFEQKEFIYDFEINEEPCYVMMDRKKLSRAINNVLDNKIKYNSNGAKLNIKTKIINDYFYIEISDDGEKIPKEYQENIFNAFVRLDKSRNSKTGGTGLGLSITKRILNKHKGDIRIIDSEIGSIFEFKLPIVK